MNFESFILSDKVVICKKDIQKAKALVSLSKNNLDVIKTIPLTEYSASMILSNSYESLRQVLEAITLSEGFKIYSHEAYTYYLKKLKEESIAQKFDRLRKIRNGINYYAKEVSSSVATDAHNSVVELCAVLINKYLKNL